MDNITFDKQLPTETRRKYILQNLLGRYKFLEKISLAKSLAGRDIYALQIGNKDNSVLFTAAYHGMEWLTSLLLFRFAYDLCEKVENEKEYTYLIKKRGITIVPCVNPDGVEISMIGPNAAGEYKPLVEKIGDTASWQANARGVDINHNFNAAWEDLHQREIRMNILGPGRTRFGGESPESEPETKAITTLCRNRYFEHAIALHSQGEEIYWDYGNKTPAISKEIAQKIAEISGYKVSRPEGLAVGGGFKDWFIDEINRPAFTIEVGKGKNPLPVSELNPIYNKLKDVFFFLAKFKH